LQKPHIAPVEDREEIARQTAPVAQSGLLDCQCPLTGPLRLQDHPGCRRWGLWELGALGEPLPAALVARVPAVLAVWVPAVLVARVPTVWVPVALVAWVQAVRALAAWVPAALRELSPAVLAV